jgi:peptide/nickel transport system substrate-binding protein
VGAAGAAGLGAATLLACSSQQSGGTSPSTTTTKQPKRGGLLRRQAAAAGATQGIPIDPHVQSFIASRPFRLMYQGLLRYDMRTLDVAPELAQKWEQPSPTEYVFTLQPNVKWQNKPPVNGRALTADDVVYSIERIRSNDPKFINRSLLDNLDRIQAVDASTIRMTTKAQEAGFIAKMSADPVLVLAKEVVEKAGNFTSPDVVIGTGPFIMTAVQELISAEYVRNPDYWKPGLPYLDGLREQYFATGDAAYAAFRAGQLDLLEQTPGSQVKDYLAQAQARGQNTEFAKDDSFPVMAQANVTVDPFKDLRVPRALRLLIDHDELRKSWADEFLGAAQLGGMFPPAMSVWDLTEQEYREKLAFKQPKDEAAKEAISLLQAAGYSQSNPLRFEMMVQVNVQGTYQEASGTLLQAQWKRLSQGIVDAQLRIIDRAVSGQVRANRSFVYLLSGNGGAISEPGVWFEQLYKSKASRNYMGWSDPAFDAISDEQNRTLEASQRKAVIKRGVSYLADNCPGVELVGRLQLNAVSPAVNNFAPEIALTGFQYEQIWLEG